MPVTHKEGDRYPLGPPSLIAGYSSGKLAGLIRQKKVGSSPTPATSFALLVKWYNTCFVIRGWQFDSVTGHQV